MPKGYQPPDNAKPGEPFEVVATLVQTEDGEFELQAIDGNPIPKDKEPDEDEQGTGEDGGDGGGGPQAKFAAKIKLPWDDEEDDSAK